MPNISLPNISPPNIKVLVSVECLANMQALEALMRLVF
jgi:hypothetical protein